MGSKNPVLPQSDWGGLSKPRHGIGVPPSSSITLQGPELYNVVESEPMGS
ncbi:hypothetical protein [Metallosphaera tengchongensis]|nr:hypothetical protein [Metallosphaera tengchongensis]